jgi:hypothetical protein
MARDRIAALLREALELVAEGGRKMMDRRDFLLTSLASGLATSFAVEAQQAGQVYRDLVLGWRRRIHIGRRSNGTRRPGPAN